MLFFDSLLSEAAKFLKDEKFIQSRNNYHYYGNNIGVISFQKSKESNSSRVKFTINNGVFSPRLAEILDNRTVSKKPKIEVCHWKTRIGVFFPKPDDFWWIAFSDSDNSAIIQDVLDKLKNISLPNIVKRMTDESLLNSWKGNQSSGLTEYEKIRYATTLLKISGKEKELTEYIEEIQATKKSKNLDLLLTKHFIFLKSLS